MKNLIIITAVATTAFSAEGMLTQRIVTELTKRSGNHFLLKTRIRKMSTADTNSNSNELPIIKNPLAQVVLGVPIGQIAGFMGGVYGGAMGFITGGIPQLIVDEKSDNIRETCIIVGAVLGVLSAGTGGHS